MSSSLPPELESRCFAIMEEFLTSPTTTPTQHADMIRYLEARPLNVYTEHVVDDIQRGSSPYEIMRAFLLSPTTTRTQFADMIRYLQARPLTVKPGTLVENLQYRVETAQLVQQRMRRGPHTRTMEEALKKVVHRGGFQFNLMQFSIFLFADMHEVKELRTETDTSRLFHSINSAESLLAIFLQTQPQEIKDRTEEEASSKEINVYDTVADLEPQPNDLARQRQDERQATLRRDGERCVFTGIMWRDVAPIWPLASTDTRARRQNTKECILRSSVIFDPLLRARLQMFVAGRAGMLDASAREWNFLCMNAVASAYWEESYFALKWHDFLEFTTKQVGDEEKTYARHRVMWHWLNRAVAESVEEKLMTPAGAQQLPPRRFVSLETPEDVQYVTEALADRYARGQTLCDSPTGTLRDHSGRLIESGRLFTLEVEAEDLQRVKTVLDAQWLVAQMAAFSGANQAVYRLNRQAHP